MSSSMLSRRWCGNFVSLVRGVSEWMFRHGFRGYFVASRQTSVDPFR